MDATCRMVTLQQPAQLVFGAGSLMSAIAHLLARPEQRVHVVTSPSNRATAQGIANALVVAGRVVTVDDHVSREPTLAMFAEALQQARAADAETVVGLGGGSPLDLAKLVAAFVHGSQRVEETFGIGLLHGRACHLVCLPTTAGTGSEVSPNAILLDEHARLKKGVISPHLVPDATFIDPELTVPLPPAVTAATGMDALTHCVEAFTNVHAHPLVDVYALEGIRLAAAWLARAVQDGSDAAAREGMSRASLYGGLCLGPVNTAAVHALAYPLGGEFHVAHGLSNAVLLPAVFRFNAYATPERHAVVAQALGVPDCGDSLQKALAGADALRALCRACGIETDLRRLGVSRSDVPRMAASAMTVQRLLRNNPRPVTQAEAERMYAECFET